MTLLGEHAQPQPLIWGTQPNQLVDRWTPKGASRGVVALIHGGFWRSTFGRQLMEALCRDLVARSYSVGNVAYRRVGERGGGWPGTCDDVSAGLAALTHRDGPLLGVVGHSAGGHLALWAAKTVAPAPRVVISVAGVADLDHAQVLGLSGDAVGDFLGGAALDGADPARRVPLGARTVLVCPRDDDVVPRAVSTTYARAAIEAGDTVTMLDPVGDHFSVLDPRSEVWAAVLATLEEERPR